MKTLTVTEENCRPLSETSSSGNPYEEKHNRRYLIIFVDVVKDHWENLTRLGHKFQFCLSRVAYVTCKTAFFVKYK